MKLSPPQPSPETAAELLAVLDAWAPKCPDAGRAAQFLRRKPPGRPLVFRDRERAIEAYELHLRTGMSIKSACTHVANSIAVFNSDAKPESIARRIGNKLTAMQADPADRRIWEEIVLSLSRRK